MFSLNYCHESYVYLFRYLTLGGRFDHYSTSFFLLLGLVSGRVVLWSYYYLDSERAYNRFIFLLLSFIISMVMLIFFSNLFVALIGWDLLGVSSFLLVIFYKNRKRLGSGIITALSNRIGDCILICVLGLSLYQGSALILLLTILLRITKSAQFPFSAWLPAAMAAPTPVRALVHSSTLVTAGVYILIRFCLTSTEPLLLFGRFTILLGGTCACAERDLKKVVALRTLSQLGVMIISLGALEKSFCFFHMICHACFKALLFICVGVCIHSIYGTQEYRRFNKLFFIMPVSVFFTVANLSLMGFIFTSGFYRKDIIIEVLMKNELVSWTIIIFLFAVGLTSCYSIKILANTILLNHLTSTPLVSLGSNRWQVKSPILLLGFSRIILGCSYRNHCGVLSIALYPVDKTCTTLMLLRGSCIGYFSTRFRHPLLCNLFALMPNRQLLRNRAVTAGEHQKSVDKGWINSLQLSLNTLTFSIMIHYTPAIGIGLGVLALVLVVYA